MSRLLNLLKKLIWRIKKNMATIYIGFAGFMFPTGIGLFVLFIESTNLDKFSQNLLVIAILTSLAAGILALIAAFAAIRKEDKQRSDEMSLFFVVVKGLAEKQGVDMEKIFQEWEMIRNGTYKPKRNSK